MKIGLAQTRPVKGDIPYNIDNHKKWIDLAIANGAEAVFFPELSVTGYEPELAAALAADINDPRFDDLQWISDTRQVIIGVGMPVKDPSGVCIGLILLQPNSARTVYSKKYLHSDEGPFFVSGNTDIGLLGGKTRIALAICYELSVPEHSQQAHRSGAALYLASVAKSATGVEAAVKTLSHIARDYGMIVLMVNCVGHCDNFESAGRTSVWNEKGVLAGQLNGTEEGLLIFDTNTKELITITRGNDRARIGDG